jgi:hypothetical protein
MFEAVLNAVLVCHHRRTTFPVTAGYRGNAAARRTYIVCLDCGAELPYDWKRMRVVAAESSLPGRRNLAARERLPVAPMLTISDGRPSAPAQVCANLPSSAIAIEATAQLPAVGERPGRTETVAAVPSDSDVAPLGDKAQRRSAPWASNSATLGVSPPLTNPAVPAYAAPPGVESGPSDAGGSGQYLARAKLRMQRVQVALRVLNALMTGVSAQPDDLAKLRAWSDPSLHACSTRELAARVVSCAVSP